MIQGRCSWPEHCPTEQFSNIPYDIQIVAVTTPQHVNTIYWSRIAAPVNDFVAVRFREVDGQRWLRCFNQSAINEFYIHPRPAVINVCSLEDFDREETNFGASLYSALRSNFNAGKNSRRAVIFLKYRKRSSSLISIASWGNSFRYPWIGGQFTAHLVFIQSFLVFFFAPANYPGNLKIFLKSNPT